MKGDAGALHKQRGTQEALRSTEEVLEECYGYLQAHECSGTLWEMPFHFYRPSLQKYSAHQWLWDSGAHMIVWAHRSPANAVQDLRTMLQLQREDGFLPEIIFWGLGDMCWLRRVLECGLYSNNKFTDISQMPNLPFALRSIWNATHDKNMLKEFLPKLIRYQDWWANSRDVDNNGLVAILHGWESGIDACPAYDAAYGIKAGRVGFWNLYPRFVKLLLSYKFGYGWDIRRILSRNKASRAPIDNWFVVFDVGLNSVYAAGWGVLARLADELGDVVASAHCRQRQARVEAAIIEHCWDKSLGFFATLYKDKRDGTTRASPVQTAQCLFPLMLESLPPAMGDELVRQLLNPDKFWTKFPVPSTSKDAPQYNPGASRLLWRGPIWPIMNWFIMEGLVTHNYTEVAGQLLDKWTNMYRASGVWEQYNPETGEPLGAVGLGMSTLLVDWLYRLRRVKQPKQMKQQQKQQAVDVLMGRMDQGEVAAHITVTVALDKE